MYAYLTKLIISKKLQFTQGKILCFDVPFALIPMESIKYMTDDGIKRGIRGITDVYFYGWVYGFIVTKNMIRLMNLRKFEERYKVSMDVVGVIGFGDYKTESFKRGVHAQFKVLGNPFALEYHPSEDFVCHYLRGMEAGGGTLVHETLMDCIEFDCAAKNGQYCIHANLNLEELEKVDKKLIATQIDFKYVRPKQKALLETHGYNPKDYGL